LFRRGADRHHVKAILLRDDRGLIFVHADGSIRPEFGLASFAGRAGETLLGLVPGHGVLAVRPDDALALWDPEGGKETVLATALPAPLVALRVSRDGGVALYVAGQGPQQLGVVRHTGAWSARSLAWTGPRILD